MQAVAERVAVEAAELVRRRRAEVFGGVGATASGADGAAAVQAKSTPTDPVTVVDTASEAFVRARLADLRPGDRVVGEEGGGDAALTDGVRWVVDPIDGTVNFLYGIGAYAVSLAAQVDGESVAGVVADVATGAVYSAAKGFGATRRRPGRDPEPLRCTDVASVDFALVATGFAYAPERRARQGAVLAAVLPRVRDIRRIGSAALDLCMVAAGAVDAHYEHGLNLWDWAAGALIAAEAGAVVTLPPEGTGGADGHVTVAVAPGIAEEFLAVLGDAGGLDPL